MYEETAPRVLTDGPGPTGACHLAPDFSLAKDKRWRLRQLYQLCYRRHPLGYQRLGNRKKFTAVDNILGSE